MERMLVVVFDNEKKAYDGSRALRELDLEGSISVYAEAVIEKNGDGTVVIKQIGEDFPISTFSGTAIGALIGLIGGPVGVAVGAVGTRRLETAGRVVDRCAAAGRGLARDGGMPRGARLASVARGQGTHDRFARQLRRRRLCRRRTRAAGIRPERSHRISGPDRGGAGAVGGQLLGLLAAVESFHAVGADRVQRIGFRLRAI